MLSQDAFLRLVGSVGEDFYPPDDEQAKAVFADPLADLFIVAGPGTGKTSCLSFRALYLMLVGNPPLRSIIATTFTKKAAASQLLHAVFRGKGFAVGTEEILMGGGGDLGEAALLCISTAEASGDRLAGKLRSNLASFEPPLTMFNPRGEELAEISSIQEFGGLLLECLDPDGRITQPLKSTFLKIE